MIAHRPDGQGLDAGGVAFRSSDNQEGDKELVLDVRPVLLGHVELHVRLSSQGPNAARAHAKELYLTASAEALRDLAQQLLETAAAADARKLKPRPVR